MSPANHKLKILFLCTGNSCRSQMAEGWARHLKGEIIAPYSAGIEKHGVNPLAVQVMAEAGVDISRQKSKLLSELPDVRFDFVITLCDHAGESCPYFPGKIIHHSFPDPPALAANAKNDAEQLAPYRLVRDRIMEYIASLPEALAAPWDSCRPET